MNEEQINKELNYLRKQKENPTGNYRKYLVNIYNFVLEDSKTNNRGWSKASTREMLNIVYKGKPDHMGMK